MEAYCVKCKKKVEVKDGKEVKNKMAGRCSKANALFVTQPCAESLAKTLKKYFILLFFLEKSTKSLTLCPKSFAFVNSKFQKFCFFYLFLLYQQNSS